MQSEVEIVKLDVSEIKAWRRYHSVCGVQAVRVIEGNAVDLNGPWSAFWRCGLGSELFFGRVGASGGYRHGVGSDVTRIETGA